MVRGFVRWLFGEEPVCDGHEWEEVGQGYVACRKCRMVTYVFPFCRLDRA